MPHIALISTPWPLFNRPSVQLGTLKAFVNQKRPKSEIDAYHFYLNIAENLGYELYGPISESTWLGEALYAGLLYPERIPVIAPFWKRKTSRVPLLKAHRFEDLCSELQSLSHRLLSKIEWHRYLLAGFSICYGQLTSSLAFIREIKRRAPHIKIVVGGSACAGELGMSLLSAFPEIDFVVQGEGEAALASLIASLTNSEQSVRELNIPGVISRDGPVLDQAVSQIPQLDALPMPDYEDYFNQIQCLHPDKRFTPRIPMEISRGCWWRKNLSPDGASGCAFCNLNLQWQGYRAKSHGRIVEELDFLTEKHEILSVSFMDNLLPARNLKALFERIQGLGKDLRLFSEIRAKTSLEVLEAMGAGGMRQVQVGIEALSSSLLRKINKGTTAMDNMEIMKNCEIHGLPDLTGNLILSFPSSDEQDVAETLTNLDFVFPFRPLKGIPFWLGYGSPVWQKPASYGIRRVGNHTTYKYLFPKVILKNLRLMIQGYQGTLRYQDRIWKPVKEKIEAWQRFYKSVRRLPGSDPILSYQDGQDFMLIRQRRPGNYDMTHKLKGTSRKIYLFCQTQRNLSHILEQFPGFGEDKVRPFLQMMVDKRLMFHEGDRYLSLAIPIKAGLKA